MDWAIVIPIVLMSGVIGVVTANIFKDWAFKKADEKYNMLERPGRHLLRFLGWGILPVIPVSLVWGTFVAWVL